MNKIFVQIAAYRDPQLIPTILSLTQQATAPEKLHICICWQHGPDEELAQFVDAGFRKQSTKLVNGFTAHEGFFGLAWMTLIEVDYADSKGTCWARNLVQQGYVNEEYTLQLDSHHRFVPGWDAKCISMLESVRYKSPKPVLSAYLPAFDPDLPQETYSQVPWKMIFDKFTADGVIIFLSKPINDYKHRTEPLHGRFYSGHFTFADGTFAQEVQHDPEYFFHGEEISICVRAFTHGYDFYHPNQMVAWHEYTRKGRVKMWDDHVVKPNETKIKTNWYELNDACLNKNKRLFGLDGFEQADLGKYGFGTQRTLKDYEEYAGVSFANKGVQQCVVDNIDPVFPPTKTYTPEEWQQSLVRHTSVTLTIKKEELQAPDCNFCVVSLSDAAGEICRRDLNIGDIHKLTAAGAIKHRIEFSSFRKPTHYTVWPVSVSRGWLTKREHRIQS